MTAQATDPTTASWETRVDGQITAIAVRRGASPAIAVATEDGIGWWIGPDGEVRARAVSGVDVPTDISVHPTCDAIAVSGTRGYALWEIDSDPVCHGSSWSCAVTHNRAGRLAVATGRQVAIHDEDGARTYVSAAAPSTVTALAWTAQGNRVAASAYGGVYQYDGEQPEPVKVHRYTGSHLAVAADPNGRWICSGNQDASVHIWRTADNTDLEMAGYSWKVTRLAFDETGRWFANNGAPELTVWDFIGKGPRGRKPQMLSGHTRVVDLDWRPGADGILASVGSEATARIWNLTGPAVGKTRKAVHVLPGNDAVAVRWLDQSRLVVARTGGVLSLTQWPPR